jgi:hypothetical protein
VTPLEWGSIGPDALNAESAWDVILAADCFFDTKGVLLPLSLLMFTTKLTRIVFSILFRRL